MRIDDKNAPRQRRRSTVFAAIALTVVGLAFVAFFARGKSSIGTGSSPIAPIFRANLPQARADAIYHGPRSTEAGDKLSPACRTFWSSLSRLDLKAAFAPQKKLALSISNQCRELSPIIGETWDKLQRLCSNYQEMPPGTAQDREWQEKRIGCYVNLTLLRALMSDYLTKDTPLSEITDPRVLADKTMARWLENPGSAAEAAERLLEVEPKLYPAAKIATMGRFLEARQQLASGGGNSPGWDRVDSHLARARDLGENDRRYLTEIEYALQISRARNPAEIQDRVAHVASNSDNPALAHFYTAYAHNRQGDRAAALASLGQAADADPRYREALRIFQSTPPGTQVSVWSLEMTVPFDTNLPN